MPDRRHGASRADQGSVSLASSFVSTAKRLRQIPSPPGEMPTHGHRCDTQQPGDACNWLAFQLVQDDNRSSSNAQVLQGVLHRNPGHVRVLGIEVSHLAQDRGRAVTNDLTPGTVPGNVDHRRHEPCALAVLVTGQGRPRANRADERLLKQVRRSVMTGRQATSQPKQPLLVHCKQTRAVSLRCRLCLESGSRCAHIL